jgi:prevent-host-death family protein
MKPVKIVGALEAKTHLSSILDEVERGEEFVITRRGRPVARLVPYRSLSQSDTNDLLERLRELRKGSTLGGLSWKDLRDAGRR